jgi:hypothetical protein
MRKKSILIIIAVCLMIVTALPALSACSDNAEPKTGTLKVGIMTPHTGIAAEKGVPLRDANLDCIEYINTELGGVNGYKIEAINLDSQYKSDQAVANINQFMSGGCLFFTTSSSTEMGYVQQLLTGRNSPDWWPTLHRATTIRQNIFMDRHPTTVMTG